MFRIMTRYRIEDLKQELLVYLLGGGAVGYVGSLPTSISQMKELLAVQSVATSQVPLTSSVTCVEGSLIPRY